MLARRLTTCSQACIDTLLMNTYSSRGSPAPAKGTDYCVFPGPTVRPGCVCSRGLSAQPTSRGDISRPVVSITLLLVRPLSLALRRSDTRETGDSEWFIIVFLSPHSRDIDIQRATEDTGTRMMEPDSGRKLKSIRREVVYKNQCSGSRATPSAQGLVLWGAARGLTATCTCSGV